MKLDVEITQGSYWKGAQIPYWLYMAFVICPITGILGLDHLLLRSPGTAFLKLLTMIPLFGFWYFYDIAQLGESNLIKQYGIGVPYYGPIGIGAGMFIDKDTPLSPPSVARPWKFIGYFLTTLLFVIFPINKVILGDYSAAITQICMYFMILIPILPLVAICWGFYDLYKILFDTRGVFEKGVVRIPPASWILGIYFDKSALGPDQLSDAEKEANAKPGMFMSIINAIVGVFVGVLKGVGSGAEIAGKSVGTAVAGVVQTGESAVEGVIKGAEETAKGAMEVAKGAENIVATGLKEVEKGIPAAVTVGSILASPQVGGSSNGPSVSSSVLLFSIVLVSIGGYLMYTLRKTMNSPVEADDPPPDARTVRSSFKDTR